MSMTKTRRIRTMTVMTMMVLRLMHAPGADLDAAAASDAVTGGLCRCQGRLQH